MSKGTYDRIIHELRHHAPFTAFGALTGIALMFLLRNIPETTAHRMFYVFHPLHVLLSAVVTTAMYRIHRKGSLGARGILGIALVGYFGSIGIATISDSLMPYAGEVILGLPNRQAHIGFIEEWWLVNPAALAGVAIGFFRPDTRFPHAGHVLLSTWGSLFHMLMAMGGELTLSLYLGIFGFLFLSVWLPCCASDIIFPLLFVRNGEVPPMSCGCGHQ